MPERVRSVKARREEVGIRLKCKDSEVCVEDGKRRVDLRISKELIVAGHVM